jgi:hypothetical protein
MNPTPLMTTTLTSVWSIAPDDVWMVGEAGTLLHFDGSSWESTPGGEGSGSPNAVWGASSDDVWVAADDGV